MKKIFITFSILIVGLVLSVLYVGVPTVETLVFTDTNFPHFYENSNTPILKVSVLIMYFVPKDRAKQSIDNWQEVVENNFKKLQDFHSVQFSGKSEITYEFFPKIIMGEKKGKEYELKTAGYSDKEMIFPISEEITRRVLTKGGDLYLEDKKIEEGERRVYFVVYEGEGGAGSGSFALLSRSYLTNKAFDFFSASFLAHEFYHTLGIPDSYEESSYVYNDLQRVPVSILTSKDIMGYVRVPIESAYLNRSTLEKMGI